MANMENTGRPGMEAAMEEKRKEQNTPETRNQDISILLYDMWNGIRR